MRADAGRRLAFGTVLLLSACGGGNEESARRAEAREEKDLHVYHWTGYIGESTIAAFEARTGIKVTCDTCDSNAVLETKLLTGRSGNDVVFPSAVPLERQIKAGVCRKLDKSKLSNLVNLDPEIMRRAALNDPGNEHAINYMWGTTGIGYDPSMIAKVPGTDRIDGRGALFDPAVAAKLAKCGIVLQARSRGAAAESPVAVAYAIPREGSYIWFDTIAIRADAPRAENAHAFLDFLMEPEVIAAISNEIGCANGNAASLRFVNDELRNDSSVYPPDGIRMKLHSDKAEPAAYMREASRAWTRIKTGQ